MLINLQVLLDLAASERGRTKVDGREFGEALRLCNEVRKLEVEIAIETAAHTHTHTHRKILCTLAFRKIQIYF